MENIQDSAIVLNNLTKKYGDKTVLNNVSLSIPKGTIFGLLGPNGAGKSSIINIISGIVKQTSGEVFVMGKDIAKQSNECKMHIGTAIQEVLLDPFFAVIDYLTFMAGYYGLTKSQARKRIDEVCSALDLTEHLHKKTRMLSGGMKRRLIIAKALLHNPEIIILDEPTAGVDIELRTSLWKYMLDLQKQGKTIILTTHYLEEAESFCDHIAFLNHGNIILNDTKNNILERISNKNVILYVDQIKPFDAPQNCIIKTDNTTNSFELKYNPSVFEISTFLSLIESSGMKIQDVSSVEASLDDIFLSVFNQ